MTPPNFFIVGAPKCGTTALSKYLSEHPQVFFSDPKEPHYFAEDFSTHRPIKTIDSYMKLFKKATDHHVAVGEGSVLYLYSKCALVNIKKFNPDAKIIVMLRDPVEMVYSLHQQYLHALYEDEADFKKAWFLQDSRANGVGIPRLCRQPELLMYGDIGRLGEQVGRLMDIFPAEQIKIINFHEFVENTSILYQEVLCFLGLDDDKRVVFDVVNEAQTLRPGMFELIARNVPAPFRNLITQLRFHSTLKFLPQLLDKIFKVKQRRSELDPDFRRVLESYFKKDQELLYKLVNRDSTLTG